MTMTDQELAEQIILRQALAKERDSLDFQVRDLSVAIAAELLLRDMDRYETDEWTAVISKNSQRETLDKTKLLEAGVSVEQLKKGTVVTVVAGSLRVSRRSGTGYTG